MKKLLVVFLLTCANTAWAQYGELWFSGGQSLLSNAGLGSFDPNGQEDDLELKDGFRFGFRLAFNGESITGHEIQYAYSRSKLAFNTPPPASEQGMAIHTGGYNYLIYATPVESRVRPFGTGGVHFSNFVPPGSSATSGGGDTKFGVNYGGGVKVRLNAFYALRFDVRQYMTPKPDFNAQLTNRSGWLRQNEVSAGFGIVF